MRTRRSARHRGRQRLARHALIAITAAMAVALAWTAWASKRRIDEASSLLVRGQVGAFLGSLRQLPHEQAPWESTAALERFLEEQRSAGLRYVGFLAADGRPVAAVGHAELTGLHAANGELTVTRSAERARAVFPPGPKHAERPTLVLELEPIVANRIQADANRTLLVSVLVAATFLVVAVVLSRLLEQREREEEQLEREGRLAQLGEMSAVLAHEMRNPLASLKGHAQLLAEQLEDGSKQRKKADRIVAEAKRLEDLGTTLLDFLRSGKVELTDARPLELVQQAVEAVDGARVTIACASAPEIWRLDPQRLRQVLSNLLTNAIQATEGGAPVEVAVGEGDGGLRISVRDHGPGLEPGEEERIFEAFYTKRAKGVGLGLAVARRIIEMHGGKLDAANHPGGGALFSIVIPGQGTK